MDEQLNKVLPPERILAEQLRMSQRQLPAAIWVGLILAIALAWFFSALLPAALVLGWLAVLIAISFIRLFSVRHIASDQFSPADARKYATRYTVTAFLLGSTWASLAFLLPYVGTEERMVIFVLLISIAGGALTTTAAYITSFYTYAYPILIAYAANAFLLPERIWVTLGVISVVYAVYMTIAGWKLYMSLQESILLRYSWQETADTLNTVKEELHEELAGRKRTEQQLTTVMADLEKAVSHLEQLAAIDELTGIPNRRSFDAAIAREWNRARRDEVNIALLMIDVDHFKNYNDIYHHQQGDVALKQVATTLSKYAKRPGDVTARYGGEEFALILSNPTPDYVQQTAEQLRQHILDLQIPHSGSATDAFLTVSIGTAICHVPQNDDYSVLIREADQALYEAKHAGRNQVKVAAAC